MAEDILNAVKTNHLRLKLQPDDQREPDSTDEKNWKETAFLSPADGQVGKTVLTEEQKAEGSARLQEAIENRIQRGRLFYQKERAKCLAQMYGDEAVCTILKNAESNFGQVAAFLEAGQEPKRLDLLKELSLKDYRDLQADVLTEHLRYAMEYCGIYPERIFRKYLLNPRIGYEKLSFYRRELLKLMTGEEANNYRSNPAGLWKKIQCEIIEPDREEYPELLMLPVSCLKEKCGNGKSKKILFVAVMRTLGIPARLSPQDGTAQYYQGRVFHNVDEVDGMGTLLLRSGDEKTVWTYLQNFTVAKKNNGFYDTLQIENGQWQQDGMKIPAAAGTYRILTANRLPNGNVFVKERITEVSEGEVTEERLTLKQAKLSELLESISLPEFTVQDRNQVQRTNRQIAHGRKALWLWLEEGKEPTEHILNELYQRKDEFAEISIPICALVKNEKALEDPTLRRTRAALPQIQIYFEAFEETYDQISRRLYQDPDSLPLIVISDEKNCGIYASCGYNVGTGDMILRILQGGNDND